MGIFKKWNKKEESVRSFGEIYNDAIEEAEELTNLAFKASGIKFTDMLDLDKESGAFVGEVIEHANKLSSLASEMVSGYDRMEKKIDDLNGQLALQDRKLQLILDTVQKR